MLWLEKEQLQALGLAVEQLLAEPQGRLASSARAVNQPEQDSFPDSGALDFKVGRLALGQDESELESGPRYVLLAYDLETTSPEEQDEPSIAADLRGPRHARPATSAQPQHRRGGGGRPAALPAVRRARPARGRSARLRAKQRPPRLAASPEPCHAPVAGVGFDNHRAKEGHQVGRIIVANRRGHQLVEWDTETDTEEARETILEAERIVREARDKGCVGVEEGRQPARAG